jgi:HK97 family phage portal protein
MASLRDLIFKSAEERRQAKMVPSRAYEAMIWGKGWEDYTRWDKKKLIEQGFERNAPFYAAAMLLSRTVASMPIYIDAKKSGRSVSTDTHPIISLMSRNMPMDQFIQMVTLWLVTTGESYINIVKSDHDNRPLGLVPIPAQNIDPIQGDYLKPITGYKYTENREIYFSEEEIIFIKLPNLREYFHGMSPGVPLGEIIDLHNAAITWNKNVALGGGVPPIIATAPGITQEESNRLKDAWQMQGGAANAHRLKIVSENLTLQRFSDKPQEAEWSEAVQQSMRMIVMALGLSSELLNDAANKTYSNFQEARKALYMEAAIPLGKMIYSAITRSLQTYYTDNPVIHIDVDKIDAIQEDRALAIDRLTKAVAAGIITPNEAREELGYTSLEDADELTPRTLRQTTTPTTTTE